MMDRASQIFPNGVPLWGHESLHGGVQYAGLIGVFLMIAAVLVPGRAAAQETGRIEGQVTSAADSQPLPGVNVVIQGTGRGTATGADGTFAIEGVEPGEYTLAASFVGYRDQSRDIEVAGGETTEVNFALQSSVGDLDEMIVVGYTEKSRRELTSSMETVGEAELEDVTANDATSLLQGKSAGLYVTTGSGDPGAEPSVRVRGTGSISAGADPLYVVDGTISGGVLPDPSNIESVTVLKDAAATALYGSRAANGVVVINTKQGTRGGETTVDIQVSSGVSEKTTGNFDVMNASQLNNLHDQMESTYADDDFTQNTDWQELAFRTATTNNVEASVSGGTESTSFYIAGSYYREEGTLIEDNLNRFGGRLNISHNITEDLIVDTRINGRYTFEDNNPAGTLYEAYTNLPWDSPYANDGSLRTGREDSWIGRDQSNFLYPLQYNYSQGEEYDFNGTVTLEYSVLPSVTLETTNQATLQRDDGLQYRDARTQAGSVNSGEVYDYFSNSSTLLTSNQFTFDRSFGNHNTEAILGFEYEYNHYDGFNAEGGGIFPGLSILDVSSEPVSIGGSATKSIFVSGFSQANYDYNKTYFASVSFRRDGSSRFGSNNRYGNFYSVAGSWMMSNEAFLSGQDWLEELKLRASYGTTGNAQIGNFVSREVYSFQSPYNGATGSRPVRLGNPNLTWEVAKKTNVGVDFNAFDRVDLSLDVYQRVNEDLLQDVPQSGVTGFTSRIENVGSVRNRGLEVALSTTNLERAVRWTTDFNIGFNDNEVLELAGGEPVLAGNQRIIEGKDLRTWYLRKWAGVDPETGRPLWEKEVTDSEGNVTGVELTSNYNEATLQAVGSATPDFTGGLRNTVEYKGFTLSAFVNFVYGNEVYHSARELFDSDGAYLTYNYMELEEDWSRWQEPGDDATHPKPTPGGNNNSNSPSSRYLEDGSYLRLKNVRLSYNVPSAWANSLNLQSARIYVSGDNLLTFTDFSGMDPEVGVSGTAGTKYPISRKVMVGVGLNF